MSSHVDSVIRDPILRVVVSTNLLRSLTRPYLLLALCRALSVIARLLAREQPRAQQRDGDLPVLDLRLLLLTVDGDPITADPGNGGIGFSPPNKTIGCAYPQLGTVGVDPGELISTGISWQGVPAGEIDPRLFLLSEGYDCTGDQIHAIAVDTSQYG